MVWLYSPCRNLVLRVMPLLTALLLAVVLPSCSSLGDREGVVGTATPVRGVLSTAAPRAAAPQPLASAAAVNVVGPTAVPTATAVMVAAATVPAAAPTFPPALPAGGFSRLRFAPAADGAPQSDFPAGTEIVFALWDYEGLSGADLMRRIWFRDDLIWITREEKWDWEEYGSEGTMRDISVFDNEGDGLHPGTYRLQLYLNDLLQVEGVFVVRAE